MPQVSRRILNQKVQDKILNLLISSIVKCNSKTEAISLIDDLLTPTEKIMLAKRFSIAYMLINGYDYDSIGDILKVSRATIGFIALWLKEKGSGLRNIVNKIKRDESMKKILEEIQDAFEDFLASTRGQNWSESKKWLWRRRLERTKPF